MTSSPRSPACPPSTPPRRPTSPSTGSTESKSSSPSPTTPTTNASTEGSPCCKIQVMLGSGSQLLGARPPRPPSTVDPRRRRHPPGDRRDVLPGHLPAGPRRPRHDPQLHPNRPRRGRAVRRRRSGRNVPCVLNLICVRRSSSPPIEQHPLICRRPARRRGPGVVSLVDAATNVTARKS